MIYELTQILYQMQAEIYPDLSGRGDIKQHRVQPYGTVRPPLQAPKGRHNSILNTYNECIERFFMRIACACKKLFVPLPADF